MQEEIIEGNESPKQEDSENINWQQFIEDRGGDQTYDEGE